MLPTRQLKLTRLLVAGGMLLGVRSASAQDADVHLVRDLNTTTHGASSNPSGFVKVGSTVYFTAWDPVHGRRLWKTDGTPEGTVLAADLLSGADAGRTLSVTAVGTSVFFGASREDIGVELWRTDGGLNGTRLVKDINPGHHDSNPSRFTQLGDTLFFTANEGGRGPQLWRTDGTAGGTAPVDDSRSCSGRASAVNGLLAVHCEDGLYSTVGTAGGMKRLLPLLEDHQLYPVGLPGVFFDFRYQGFNEEGSAAIITTDGTGFGTRKIPISAWTGTAFGEDYEPEIVAFGESIAFGQRVSSKDGTNVGSSRWIMEPRSTDVPRLLSMQAHSMIALENEALALTMVNGTAVLSKVPSGGSALEVLATFPDSDAAFLLATGGEVLFTTSNPSETSLWRTDGSVAGTQPLTTGIVPQDGALAGNNVIFAHEEDESGNELWRTNVADGTTELLKDIAPAGYSATPTQLTAAGAWLFYVADDGAGLGLWRSDGREARRVTGLESLTNVSWMDFAGTTLYISEDLGDAGPRLWLVDMATGHAYQHVDLGYGTAPPPKRLGEVLYVTVHYLSGTHLWTFDGRMDTASPVRFPHGIGGFLPNQHRLYFIRGIPQALWTTDGTVEGTVALREIPGFPTVFPLDDTVAVLNELGEELGSWILPPDGDDLVRLTEARLYEFRGSYGSAYYALEYGTSMLWKGTGDSMAPAFDLEELATPLFDPTYGSFTGKLLASGGLLYLSTFDPDGRGTGGEPYQRLWSSDGTREGTVLLFTSDKPFTPVALPNGGVAFYASTEHGDEPWISEGTPETTRLLYDVAPGPGSSRTRRPTPFVGVGDLVFFVADDGTHGAELWVYGPAPATTEPATGCSVSVLPSTGGQIGWVVVATLLAQRRLKRRARQ